LKIEGRQAISFTLEAHPTNDQPRNGRISRNNKALTYASLTKGLMELYLTRTEIFAKDIKAVFKDNSKLLGCGDVVIQECLHYLLFEIGRRLVNDEKVPEDYRREKQAYDSLPISEAITKIVKLFNMKDSEGEEASKGILCLVNPNWLSKTLDIDGLAPSL